jgi:hypothetical protein
MAAEQVGEDGKGRDGLVGYLKTQAKNRPELFVPLLARVLPPQMTGEAVVPIRMITANMNLEEASRIYAETIEGD